MIFSIYNDSDVILHYQGNSFTKRFDANSYLYISKAIDYFDLAGEGSLAETFYGLKIKFLVISVDSDWLYPPSQSKDIVLGLSANDIDVRYCEIKSSYGHDAFLIEAGQLNYLIAGFLSDTLVKDVMNREFAKIKENSSIENAAEMMLHEKVTHLPVTSNDNHLLGIVTAWDISKSVARNYTELDDIMTKDVIVASPEDPIELTARKMKKYNISSLPVVDENDKVIGIVTTDHISTLMTGTN
jgi:homoserine O-acetyltransferase